MYFAIEQEAANQEWMGWKDESDKDAQWWVQYDAQAAERKGDDGTRYSVAKEKTPGEIQLERDAAAFAKKVDEIFEAGNATKPVQMLTKTPAVMDLLSGSSETVQKAQTGGIWISAHTFNQAFTSEEKGGHPDMNDPEIFKQLPKALADPLAIFDPVEGIELYFGRLSAEDLIFMLTVKDKNGATIRAYPQISLVQFLQ